MGTSTKTPCLDTFKKAALIDFILFQRKCMLALDNIAVPTFVVNDFVKY